MPIPSPMPADRSAPLPTVTFGASPKTLFRIKKASVSFAVWQRHMPPGVAEWLDRVPPDTAPAARFVCRSDDVRSRVTEAFAGHAVEPHPALILWREDVIEQIERFIPISGASFVEVRLDVIDSNACARFHADNVGLRLLTTYRGPGTEWLDHTFDHDTCSVEHYAPEDVRQIPRFAVAVIKGRKAENRSGPLVLHRSPPIEGSRHTRFLLCVSSGALETAHTVC